MKTSQLVFVLLMALTLNSHADIVTEVYDAKKAAVAEEIAAIQGQMVKMQERLNELTAKQVVLNKVESITVKEKAVIIDGGVYIAK